MEEEIKRFTERLYNETFGNGQGTLDEFDWEDIATVVEETAHHFVNWQKEHQPLETQQEQDDKIEKIKKFVKEEADGWQDTYCYSMRDNILSFLDTLSEEPSKSLEEAAEELADEHGFIKNPDCKPAKYSWQAVRDVFIEAAKAGAEWQKEQMLKDSVECEVTDIGFNYLDLALFEAERLGLNKGDKVKVIVLKDNEDENK